MLSKSSVAATAVILTLTLPVSAHHSHAQYDVAEYTRVDGIVAEVHWFNPHAWVYLTATGDDGEPLLWALESASPRQLQRNGITRNVIKVGDSVSARCHQLLDGSNGCLLGYLKTSDGVERLWD